MQLHIIMTIIIMTTIPVHLFIIERHRRIKNKNNYKNLNEFRFDTFIYRESFDRVNRQNFEVLYNIMISDHPVQGTSIKIT